LTFHRLEKCSIILGNTVIILFDHVITGQGHSDFPNSILLWGIAMKIKLQGI